MPVADWKIVPLDTLSATTLAVINSRTGELVETGKVTVAMATKVLVAEAPDEKLMMAFRMLPLTILPVVKSKAPVGQPEPLDMLGAPKTAVL